MPRGQLPPLLSIFAAPVMASGPALGPEYEWLDPQLLSQPSMQTTVEAVADSSDMITMPETSHETDDDSEQGVDDDDEIRP